MGIQPKDRDKAIKAAREWRARSVEKYRDRVRDEALAGERAAKLPPVNRKRKAKRVTADEIYGDHHHWVKTQPCAVAFLEGAECFGITDSHHVKSVGSGGKDEANCLPLCRFHHREVHTLGRDTFAEKYGIDLQAEAEHLWKRYKGDA